ncbi:MAG: apolipoprotein N-acyltransferase [Treponemataceae bacterium]
MNVFFLILSTSSFKNLGLLVSAIVLFALPQPNFFSSSGYPFFAYIAFVPLFLLVRFVSWKSVWLWGIAYGVGCYSLYSYWLATFHPLGLTIIASLYGMYLLFTLPLLKLSIMLFPNKGWLVQWIIWCAYEYVKTLGFTGFHYGIIGYSQWQFLPLIQLAQVTGVWGLSALVSFPSALISDFFSKAPSLKDFSFAKVWLKRNGIFGVIWSFLFVLCIVCGLFFQQDFTNDNKKTVALIQTNSDPWIGGITAYHQDLKVLKDLSMQAIAENPSIDFVVWPETAFVPSIEYHYRLRKQRDRYDLVDELLSFIDSMNVPFILGNGYRVEGYNQQGAWDELDYNAALLFKPNQNVIPPNPDKYFKMKLVPFTESFPYAKIFPSFYKILLENDTHLWEKGRDPTIFTIDDVKFATPICFEDTFSFIGRQFALDGAQFFVNLSNDAWSKSLACQYQHLSMAVFRSVENKVSSVRSTSSGQTAIIDPNGKITAMAPAFTQTYLVGDFPVRSTAKKTFYTKHGDYLGIFFVILACVLLVYGLIRRIMVSKKTC